MKIIAAIDSFKGSMTSAVANEAVKKALPEHDIIPFSIADGGEGTTKAFVEKLNGELMFDRITGPDGKELDSYFGWIDSEKLAIIEVAEGAGITKVPSSTLNPRYHTSFGVGEQIVHALDNGAEQLIIGLGGSATVDGGFGMLQALGVSFYDGNHQLLPMFPIDLGDIAYMDTSAMDARVQKTTITLATDVTNPLLGEEGAVTIFGPQKGILPHELELFEQKMHHYQHLVCQHTKSFHTNDKGAGAAGGIGFALYAFLGAVYANGLDLLADKGNLDDLLKMADLVITGEGKFDHQSMAGKVPVGISRRAQKYGVPVILFSGSIEGDFYRFPEENIAAILPIVDRPMSLEEAIQNGPYQLEKAVKRAFHLLQLQI